MVAQDLFGGHDPSLVIPDDPSDKPEVESVRRRIGRVETRLANGTEALKAVLPSTIHVGESWHVITRGDVDMLSFIKHLLSGAEYLDFLLISTWRVSHGSLEELHRWLDTGIVDRFDLVIDPRFPRLGPTEYTVASQLTTDYGGRIVLARNHSKVALLRNARTKLVIETSANCNPNMRIEQTAVHHSPELFDFYADFFARMGRPVK